MNLIKNMLILNQGLPLFNLFNVNQVELTMKDLIIDQHEKFLSLEEKLKVNTNYEEKLYDLAIYETEKLEEPLSFAWSVVSHLKSVKNTEELREVYDKCMPDIIKEGSYMAQSVPLFNALKKLKDSEDLNSVQKRIIDSSYKSMFLSGIDLDNEKRERFNEIKIRLSELSTKFSNNILDYIKNFELVIDSSDKNMQKIPKYALELYSQNAKKKYPESTPDNGPWIVTLDMPSYIPFMSHYPDSKLREQLYKSSVSKASKDDKNNLPLIKEILELKKEKANLLGFNNYVEYSLEMKMANSQLEIENMLNNLFEKSKDRAKEEIDEIKKFKLEYENINKEIYPFMVDMYPWDIMYYSEKMKEVKLGLKEEDLKPYFSLDNVLDGLFKLANNLFNIRIEESKDDIQVWHEDVKFFNIYNSDHNEPIASFYLDPYSRPGEKKGGAWMNVCVQKSKLLNKKPVAYLICNGSPPLKENGKIVKPSLMTFNEVVTLFHEFGHGLQHMLTKVEESGAAGINNIEWDAVELPSQFMENWCYHKPTLKSFAKHYETNEEIPDDLFNKILENKNYNSGLGMLRQIYFSMMDLHLYSNDMNSEEDIVNVQKEFAKKYLVTPIIEEDRFLCSFSHIFAGGYSAGYYSYKWAEIMSADAFGLFEEYDLEDKEVLRELGLKFRSTVLSLGGGTPPLQVYKKFRGRKPNIDALLRHNGLE